MYLQLRKEEEGLTACLQSSRTDTQQGSALQDTEKTDEKSSAETDGEGDMCQRATRAKNFEARELIAGEFRGKVEDYVRIAGKRSQLANAMQKHRWQQDLFCKAKLHGGYENNS